MIVRELVTKLGFDLNDKPLKQAERGIASLKNSAFALTAALTAIGGGLFALLKSAANAGDEFLKTSQRIGIGIESLQKLQYAAALADVGSEEFSQGLTLLSRKIVEATTGSKEAAETFARMGITLKDSLGKIKPTDALLLELSDKFQKMLDGAEKTALALSLFGRAGARLIPFLNQGAVGTKALGRELEDFGIIISGETAKASEEFNDNLKRLQIIFLGLKNVVGAKLLPLFLQMTEEFIRWLKLNREIIRSRLDEFIRSLVVTFKSLFSVVKVIGKVLGAFVARLGGAENATKLLLDVLVLIIAAKFVSGIGSLTLGFFRMVKALKAATAAAALFEATALTIPLLIGAAVVAAIGAIYLIYDDVQAFLQGCPSLFAPLYEKTIPIIESLKESWKGFIDFLKDAWLVFITDFLPGLTVFEAGFDRTFKGAIGWVVDLAKWFVNLTGRLNDFLQRVLGLKSVLSGLSFPILGGPLIQAIRSRAAEIRFEQRDGPLISAKTAEESPFSLPGLEVLQQTPSSPFSLPPLEILQGAHDQFRAPPSFLSDHPDVTNRNDFRIESKVEVNVKTGADPDQIGEAVRKATEEEFERNVRNASRAIEAGAY